MSELISRLGGNTFVAVLGLIAAALFVHFIWQYVVRGIGLSWKLRKLSKRIRSLDGRPRVELRSELDAIFSGTHAEHAWREFEETLHNQSHAVGGQRRVADVRATVPAEAFINLETTVDPRIGAEYFKHLPGLFTGLGIVGTFSGLIQGLLGFKPNLDADALKLSLASLFEHVQGAFLFSAGAIGLAMTVTLVEKLIYASCAKWVGETTMALDSLFRSGVGEEYLSDLLKASQENATQTRQLKESMVDDLKVLLTNLTDRQIQATQQLSVDLGQRIEGSLKEPLASLAETVRQASGQQTAASSHILENLMSAFMAQMRETLGSQLGDLSSLMQQSAQSMTQVEAAMRALVGDLQRASSESAGNIQATVRELIESMSEHQRQHSQAMNGTATNLLERVEATVGRLAAQQEAMTQRSAASMSAVANAMDARFSSLAKANEETALATAKAITSLGEISGNAITGLNEGAAAVANAVGAVHQATDRLARLTEQMGGAQSNLVQSAQQLTQSSGVLGAASQSLTTATTSLAGTASRLEEVAKVAGTEAEMRSQLLNDLRTMTEQSRVAGQELATLSEEVRGALASNIDSFGTSVSKVLSQHLADYQKQLGDAIGMLRSALEALAEVAVDARP